MTKNTLALTMAAAVCSAAMVAAQAPGAAQSGAAASTQMRMTGCIERADQLTGNGSTLGTAAASADVDSLDLVLIKAMPATESTSANANAARSAGTSGDAAANVGKMYRIGSDKVKMNSHVGHRVEISGSVQQAEAGTAAAPAAVDKNNPTAANAPFLKVDSLRMLSDTCPK
jgi:hypothetical protein